LPTALPISTASAYIIFSEFPDTPPFAPTDLFFNFLATVRDKNAAEWSENQPTVGWSVAAANEDD